jgi:hypothetical protein
MKTNLNRTITTQDEAEDFLNELFENGEDFHPEDDARNIIRFATGERLFTDEEADKLNDLMSSMYDKDFDADADFDPCGYLLDLQEEEDRRMKLARPAEFDSEEKAFRDKATYSERHTDND